MSFKEWVVFVIGCLALGAGLLFGQPTDTTVAKEQDTVTSASNTLNTGISMLINYHDN